MKVSQYLAVTQERMAATPCQSNGSLVGGTAVTGAGGTEAQPHIEQLYLPISV